MKEYISLKDIARMCNVSISTVSKAMNDRPDISSIKKAEIRKVAKEMDYVPNYMALTLKSKHTRNIGVLMSETTGQGLMHEHLSRILNSFKDTIEERGYVMTFLNASSSPNRLSYVEQCKYMKFDGVFILCVDYYLSEVRDLLVSNIPVVVVDHVDPKHINVASNQRGDMHRLLQFVYERGHRRIAYIHGQNCEVTRYRLEVYKSFMREHDLPLVREYMYSCPYRDVERAAAFTRAILAVPEKPTCILYPDDLTAVGGLGTIQEMGIRVPEDISIAGYDGISIASIIRPRIATVHQDTVSMGIQAGNKLINRIEFPDTAIKGELVVVDGRVEPGESVLAIKSIARKY
ncbi:LacI family DNA-binding transcriptional regulator [Robinsoniella peoriensis]|uniref:LacI family DNA-binding transcriptional regulator n=1 Tax=Robinsoniella peoriensis TaxID=180332 RepID=UPI00085C6124|nr:LacI family DNA-binding transcriptional regulator [Robinsoniella peoriensis]